MAGLFGSAKYDELADKDPKKYYKETPFVRSLWEQRLPTWLGQAYKQDIEPAIDKLPSPTTMEGALTYAKMPYEFLKVMATGATDTIKSSMDDPTNPRKALELALMIAGAGGLLGRAPGGLGANVFQGGPHRYGPEGAAKSLSHVGKGEGAQSYGWGRYDAGVEGVGRQYADMMGEHVLKGPNGDTLRPSEIFAAGDESLGDAVKAISSMPPAEGVKWLRTIGLKNEANTAQRLIDEGYTSEFSPGHLYKHDLPDKDIAKYLDYDAPLSQQPESVKAAIKKMDLDELLHPQSMVTTNGERLYNVLKNKHGSDKAASEALGRAGIPGLKYYDGKSRNKPLKEIKESFLTELPEDAGIDEIVELFGKGHFSPDNERILKALAADDWFGFDFPAQAISAALGKNINNWDPSAELIKAIAKAKEGGTRNYVTWDQDVLNRMKLLERNGESMIDALR